MTTSFLKSPSTRGKFPARLHVLIARDARVALVIRRGPSNSVCTILWDRERDIFELGQWMRGRIYERRCDLSANGRWFIYFAMNGRWQSETKGSWTAISRAPYLKAEALYGKGDCWQGGGLFLSNKDFWINGSCCHFEIRKSPEVHENKKYQPAGLYGGECLTVYYNRLQRDGWTMSTEEYQGATLFEKKLKEGWILRKLAFAEVGAPPGRGCYWDAHELSQDSTQTRLLFPEWEWCDYVDGRLVWAVEGQLRCAHLGRGKLENEKLLQDFNGMKFQALPACYT